MTGKAAGLQDQDWSSLLEVSPEPDFDRLTRLASTIFGLPVSVVRLADGDGTVVKSCHGLDPDGLLWPVLDRAAKDHRTVVVADAQADRRFADLPCVTGDPRIRFFAAAPLIGPDGSCFGSLDVMDRDPNRRFGETECSILEGLAQTAADLHDARAQQIRLLDRTREIAHLANQDPLTELGNRRHLDRVLGQAIKAIRPSEQIVVYYVDLDGFKKVNDTLGHASGDLLLREVTKRLRGQMGAGDTIARIGGDEFAIMQRGDQAAAQAPAFANGIIGSVARPYGLYGQSVRIGTSIGASVGRHPVPTPEQMLKEADQALYRAKAAGRGRFAMFDNSRPNVMVPRFALTSMRFGRAPAALAQARA